MAVPRLWCATRRLRGCVLGVTQTMRDQIKRLARVIGAVGMAGALVLAVAGAPIIGPPIDSTVMQANPTDDAEAIAPAVGAAAVGGVAIGGAVATAYHDWQSPDDEDLAEADWDETTASVHGHAATLQQKNEEVLTSVNNTLEQSKNTARMKAKNELIKAMNEDESESVAKERAIEAVEDYYAKQQQDLIVGSNTTMIDIKHMVESLESHDDHGSDDYLEGYTEDFEGDTEVVDVGLGDPHTQVENKTLVNGTEAPITALNVDPLGSAPEHLFLFSGDGNWWHAPAPNSQSDGISFAKTRDYGVSDTTYSDLWKSAENYESDVEDEIGDFADEVYDSYEAGEINSSDLVDPYLAASEYSPENETSAFTVRSLSAMGIEPPANLSSDDVMNITDTESDETVQGLLLSDGVPSDGFEVGVEYDPENLSGPQYVQEPDGSLVELDNPFVIDAASIGGEEVSQIDYRDIDHTSANMSEYQETLEQNAELMEDINERQEALRGGGTIALGGLSDMVSVPILGSVPAWSVIAGIGAVLWILGRR